MTGEVDGAEFAMRHEYFLFTPRVEQAFNSFGIKFDATAEWGIRLSQFLAPRLFDRGMVGLLPPLETVPSITPSLAGSEQAQPYNNDYLPGVPVFASGAARYLVGKGYTLRTMIDFKNLYGANELGKLNGDRLLRQGILSLAKSLGDGYALLRWGGDEFMILEKPNGPSLSDEKLDAALTALRAIPVFYQNKGESRVAGIEAKKAVPSLIESRPPVTDGGLSSRMARLQKSHPELRPVFDGIREHPQLDDILLLMESSQYDGTLQPIIATLAKDPQSKSWQIDAFKDFYDLTEHMTSPGGANDYQAIRLEFPGILKRLNDRPGFGYAVGSQFIQQVFFRIVNGLVKQGITTAKVLRRGSDFYLFIDKTGSTARILESLQDELHGLSEFKKGEEKMSVVTDPVLTAAPIENLSSVSSQTDLLRASDENVKILDNVFTKLANDSSDLTVKHFTRLLQTSTPETSATLVEHICAYFDPNDKRGAMRLKKLLGTSDQEIAVLSELPADSLSQQLIKLIQAKANG
ncbi:diguanylate cyclase [Candidatus Roizmanbacteria bacterium]|nr:diguanylate cyclase [Candidatus Roizmanbacteria bacterium]